MASLLAGRPSERLVMAGVTGTSGKTTTTYLLDGLLARAPPQARFLRHDRLPRRGGAAAIPAPHTTPEATELQPMLAALVADGGTAAILECSSHALVLERLAGCSFDVAVFLNLSRDHLDFHRDMDDYFEAKSRLFATAQAGREGGRQSRRRVRADASRADWSRSRTVGFLLEGEEGAEQTRPAALAGAVALAAAAAGRDESLRDGRRARDARTRRNATRNRRSTLHPPSKKKTPVQQPH